MIPTDLKTNPNDKKIIADDDGNFNQAFLKMFKKINMKQELVLIRSSNDLDCIYSNDLNELPKITITKLFWKVPHVSVSMPEQLRFTKLLNKNVELPILFRSWKLIEYPALPHSTNHTWPVKISTKGRNSSSQSPSQSNISIISGGGDKMWAGNPVWEWVTLGACLTTRKPEGALNSNLDSNKISSKLVLDCHINLQRLATNNRVKLRWIPGGQRARRFFGKTGLRTGAGQARTPRRNIQGTQGTIHQ
ncbi:hypothetical protein NQ317_000366 [Molorchus minor]|uniref:Double jelly roll-like domain-containing protein n=1 Tax=Molorchus minor TaxID=1323400 RepID=A0ABQ9JQI8_9CUCU|nr:hypothetical protein NQ317_000366 [Molorchus minor]